MHILTSEALGEIRPKHLLRLPGQDYNATVDYVRMGAAVVIVLFHSNAPLGQFGEAAVGVFVIFMVMFSLRGSQKSRLSTSQFIAQRGPRLLQPYLIWSLIYMALFMAQAIIKGQPLFESILLWLPPEGSQRQLWFLPWALLVCVALNFAASLTWNGKTGPKYTAALIPAVARLTR